MNRTLRGRPRLDLRLEDILMAVRREGKVTAGARGLGCSPAYIHSRLKAVGLDLQRVLGEEHLLALLKAAEPDDE